MHTKYLKRIIAFVILLSMVFTTVAMAMPYGQAKKLIKNRCNWEDVQKFVKGKGIMKGYPDGKFYENHNVKRADVIVMIDRAFKLSALIDYINKDYKDIFDDVVDENEYYFHAIYIAKALGITKGKGNNKFHPKHSVTIGEVILLIERAMGKNKHFEFDEDIDLSENYRELVGEGKDLDDYATRGEIAAMLYYVLTGSKYDSESEIEYNLKTIARTIKEDEILRFDDEYGKKDSLIESIEDKVDDLEYVQFTKPLNENNTFLYYEYDSSSRSNSFVTNGNKYYVNPSRRQMSLSEVTIVPKISGVLEIEYVAYDDEGDSYKGIIEITVENDNELVDIEFTGYENTPINFRISKFKEVFNKEFDYSSNDKISFELPDGKFGSLYFDKDGNGKLRNSEKIEAKNSFALKQMNLIYFYPAQNYVNEKAPIVIEYTVQDKDKNLYEGNINITVKSLLDTLTIDLEDDDFGQEVSDHLAEFDDYDFETIIFERLNKDDDYDLHFEGKTRSLIGRGLDIDELKDLVFNPDKDFDGTRLTYTVTTNDGLKFTGLVIVESDH
ncbi:MAG: S-layer homology domain-containing protein [Tissierellia bacterium]|nr:S-layer homology domain-containing protein [Tissierellia bacterium]